MIKTPTLRINKVSSLSISLINTIKEGDHQESYNLSIDILKQPDIEDSPKIQALLYLTKYFRVVNPSKYHAKKYEKKLHDSLASFDEETLLFCTYNHVLSLFNQSRSRSKLIIEDIESKKEIIDLVNTLLGVP